MLRTADYRGVLAVLESIELSRSLDAFRTGTLDALDQYLGYEVSAFLIVGTGRGSVDGVLHGRPQRRLDRHLARWSGRDARPSAAARALLEPGRPIDLEEIYAALGPAAARQVSEYLRSERLAGLMTVALKTVGPTRAVLTLLSPRRNGFGSADRERLALLAPHLGNLIRGHLAASSPAGPASALTPREAQTVDLVAAGCSNREIAERLAVTESTVKKHVSAALTKLGVSSRTQLTLAWLNDEPSPRAVGRPPGAPRAQRLKTERRASATRAT
jgi:DNA-binding CsgD family transcriptional regulator